MTIEIIAELAQGFEGHPEQARLLMRAAAAAGADAAKYQLVYADELATPDYKHYQLFRSLEMADSVWADLVSYATELGIELHLDIFGTRGLQLASRIGVAAVKLHGTDIANVGLLADVAASPLRRVLLGAGGAHHDELLQALGILAGKDVVLLLGFQGYPTPTETNQIARVRMLAERLRPVHPNVRLGFADHAAPDGHLRYAVAATAVGAGAVVLEKHLTLSKIMQFEDYESALDPDEFRDFTRILRACSEAFGESVAVDDFGMSEAEQAYRKMIRRHVVARRDLQKGSPVAPTDLMLKRTSADAAMTDLGLVYQRRLTRDLRRDEPVTVSDIE